MGFERVKQRASARDLMVLADLARYARKSSEATQALMELRRRFAGSAEAGRAAFLLGRIAADQQGAPLRGAEWFATYLAEHPDGSFASEALGRLLECQQRGGRIEAARKSAGEYLRRYPNGPYGALAQRALAASRGPNAPAGGAERR
jgi:TolA-binding protein